ncbi:cryptochrome/photolyase family protein [Thermaurantiacus sp.]
MLLLPILGDQLSPSLASLCGAPRSGSVLFMAEVMDEARYVPHHKQKLALVFSAMRHFAEERRAEGWQVDYRRLDDPNNLGSLDSEIRAAAARHGASHIRMTEAGEHRVRALQATIEGATILEDDRFLVSPAAFTAWRGLRKRLRLEDFYRWQRRETGILMEGDTPVGGQWNFDAENRKPLPPGLVPPPPPRFAPDAITREVIAMVEARFPKNFGTLARFHWPVTRSEALAALADFTRHRLPHYGDYQDALAHGEETLFHALLSPALNLGLLTPRELIDVALAALSAGSAPLNAVEGFIRQILGWREYVRLIYLAEGPEYLRANMLGATRPLPAIYWQGESGMACFDAAFTQTRDLAYAHHIQRLMVLGNFALLAGVDPHALHHWFLIVYADAYEWVEAPNVIGMSQWADGGLLGSKPYAASGAYIARQGNHCRHCRFDVKAKTGEGACPFNRLYWDFIARNEPHFASNPRMGRILESWRRFPPARKTEVRADAARFLATLA